MSTISVPLTVDLQKQLDSLVKEGLGANRADVMRRALERFAEEAALNAVFSAEADVRRGKVLRGNARDILLGK